MKLVFVIKAMAAGAGGGAERVLATIAGALSRRGHEVSLVSFDRLGAEDFYKSDSLVNRVRLGVGRTAEPSGVLSTAVRMRRLRTAVKALDPDIVVGFMHSAYIPLGFALAGTGIAVVGSERTSFTHLRTRRLQRWLLRASLPFLRNLTVNSNGVRQGFPQWASRRMVVIPNPVSPASPLADPIGPASKLMLAVGGLRPEKDHATLLEAFAAAAEANPDWRLKIVGDGPLRSNLEAQARARGIEGRVTFAGAVTDVEREYAAAQLFVLPSSYEAFPNCLAEALAHGLPSIAFADCPGANELIKDGENGLLARGGDRVESLRVAIEEMMNQPQRREELGSMGPASVSNFSLESIVDQWEELFRTTAGVAHRTRPTA